MDLSPESFERLLKWLHPNREEAGQEYQKIRARLIGHFRAHGCPYPDNLADATMDRAAEKLTPAKIQEWVGNEKVKYFLRVAYYILREDRGKVFSESQMPDGFEVVSPENEDLEPVLHCLEKCLRKLSASDSDLIKRYYRGDKSIKRETRIQLAQDLNIDLPNLRVRAHRIRTELRKCIEKCLQAADKITQSMTYGLVKTQKR